MKKLMALCVVLSLLTISPNAWAYYQNIDFGGTNVFARTYVSGTFSSSLISAEAGAYVNMFGVRADAFLFRAKADETSGSYLAKIGPYKWSGSSSFSKSYSCTFLSASGNFTIGPVPVTVKGKLGISANVTMSVGIKYVQASAAAAGTGSASAGVGISGWSAGVQCDLNPIVGGTLTARSDLSAKFTIKALKIYLKVYVDYLFGAGHHEKTLASYGPLWTQTYPIW